MKLNVDTLLSISFQIMKIKNSYILHSLSGVCCRARFYFLDCFNVGSAKCICGIMHQNIQSIINKRLIVINIKNLIWIIKKWIICLAKFSLTVSKLAIEFEEDRTGLKWKDHSSYILYIYKQCTIKPTTVYFQLIELFINTRNYPPFKWQSVTCWWQ